MTEDDSAWWRGCTTREPVRWDSGRAIYDEPGADIAVDNAEEIDRRRWSNMRWHHYRWLKSELEILPDGSRLVDIGAGPVQFADLTERLSVCHVDHFPYRPINIVTDISRPLPLADSCSDAVMLSNVLEHVYAPDRLLSECHRLLRPEGYLFLVVPFLIKEHQAPYDFFRYTRYGLRRLAEDAGFSDISVDPLGNIFDVYDVDRWVRAQDIREGTGGARRVAARGLIKIQNLAEKMLKGILPDTLVETRDHRGFAQSFGMLARKAQS